MNLSFVSATAINCAMPQRNRGAAADKFFNRHSQQIQTFLESPQAPKWDDAIILFRVSERRVLAKLVSVPRIWGETNQIDRAHICPIQRSEQHCETPLSALCSADFRNKFGCICQELLLPKTLRTCREHFSLQLSTRASCDTKCEKGGTVQ